MLTSEHTSLKPRTELSTSPRFRRYWRSGTELHTMNMPPFCLLLHAIETASCSTMNPSQPDLWTIERYANELLKERWLTLTELTAGLNHGHVELTFWIRVVRGLKHRTISQGVSSLTERVVKFLFLRLLSEVSVFDKVPFSDVSN